ncbi:hypothetical protein F7725_028375 [Dissostichus mawsoni]|uniref:Uncharacterized protein n=1 Tax=Dissostichus mawsoni TaxID=36200 RepID=A0A7J5XGR2_DISMA|nr:hypothetical protein F7725_028375 [Dissostichus mawsoni]
MISLSLGSRLTVQGAKVLMSRAVRTGVRDDRKTSKLRTRAPEPERKRRRKMRRRRRREKRSMMMKSILTVSSICSTLSCSHESSPSITTVSLV